MSEGRDHNIPKSDNMDKPEDLQGNLCDRVLNSAFNLAPSLGSLDSSISNFSIEKGASSNNSSITESREEFLKTSSEFRANGTSNLAQESFSSKVIEDFGTSSQSTDVYKLPKLDTLSSDQIKRCVNSSSSTQIISLLNSEQFSFDDCISKATSHEEKIKKYRDLVKNKNSKAETFIEKDYGYFDGKFLSSQEVLENLNEQNVKKQNSFPTYLPDAFEYELNEDGEDVVQLLNEPTTEDELIEEFTYASQLLVQEESSFKTLLKMKYDRIEKAPESDIIRYLESYNYLEDVYGLPVFREKLSHSLKTPIVPAHYRKKALERLVLIKNHVFDS